MYKELLKLKQIRGMTEKTLMEVELSDTQSMEVS